MKNYSRTSYVDIAKGIAILSVVLLHVDFVYPKFSFINISAMLGWYWHVPVFFLIGGFFLKEERLLQPANHGQRPRHPRGQVQGRNHQADDGPLAVGGAQHGKVHPLPPLRGCVQQNPGGGGYWPGEPRVQYGH